MLFEIDPETCQFSQRASPSKFRDAVAGEILNVERAIAAQKANVLAAQAVLAQAETARTQARIPFAASNPLLARITQPPTQWKRRERRTPRSPQ